MQKAQATKPALQQKKRLNKRRQSLITPECKGPANRTGPFCVFRAKHPLVLATALTLFNACDDFLNDFFELRLVHG